MRTALAEEASADPRRRTARVPARARAATGRLADDRRRRDRASPQPRPRRANARRESRARRAGVLDVRGAIVERVRLPGRDPLPRGARQLLHLPRLPLERARGPSGTPRFRRMRMTP